MDIDLRLGVYILIVRHKSTEFLTHRKLNYKVCTDTHGFSLGTDVHGFSQGRAI